MKRRTYFAVGLLLAIAACSASGSIEQPKGDAGGPTENVVSSEAGPSDDGGSTVDLDAERPLVCGDAGFCETKLPKSDLGLPLSLRSIFAVGANDVWSVSAEGFVLHYDGASWTVEYRANHELYAVWATPTGVWAGGERGLLFHRNAAGEWSHVDSGHTAPIRAIYGSSDSDVWFTRNDGALDHFDGTTVTKHPVDIPGLRITSVFGRPGIGMYALGHVGGELGDGGKMLEEPHAFELAAGNVTPFNPSLPNRRGFVPVSGFVTTSVNPDRRIYMVGYERSYEVQPVTGLVEHFDFAHCVFGQASAIDVVKPDMPGLFPFANQRQDISRHVLEMNFPGLNYKATDIRLPLYMWQVLRWNGLELTSFSLAMGRDFPPTHIFAAHAGDTESWMVGDGFALKGANP